MGNHTDSAGNDSLCGRGLSWTWESVRAAKDRDAPITVGLLGIRVVRVIRVIRAVKVARVTRVVKIGC